MPYINEENKVFEKFQEEIENLKSDLEQQKKMSENQILNLRIENDELLNVIEKMRSESESIEDRIKEHRSQPDSSDNHKQRNEELYIKCINLEEELSNYKTNFEQIIAILREEEKNRINLEDERNNLNDIVLKIRDQLLVSTSKFEKKCLDYETLDKINNGLKLIKQK
jgi:hypothetical protein